MPQLKREDFISKKEILMFDMYEAIKLNNELLLKVVELQTKQLDAVVQPVAKTLPEDVVDEIAKTLTQPKPVKATEKKTSAQKVSKPAE